MPMNAIKEKLKSHFKDTHLIVSAPGRINIIGEHIDYNDGFVLPAAIDKAIYLGFTKKEANPTSIQSIDFGETIEIDGSKQTSGWAAYFEAIHQLMKEKEMWHQSVSCKIISNLPVGAGISSSAALCCGYLYGLNELNEWGMTRLEIAKFAQQVEHAIGVNCGLMDQYAVMFGMKDKAILLDCKNETHQYVDLKLRKHALYLINSNIKHELIGTPYNDRRRTCEKIIRAIQDRYENIPSWQNVKHHMVDEVKEQLTANEHQQGIYVVEEFQRVKYCAAKLIELNVTAIGKALYETHEGLSKQFQVSCDETDLLVALAKQNNVLGARMMGGGFGGCTINVLEKETAQNKIEVITAFYKQKTGLEANVIPVNIGKGVDHITYDNL